MNRDSLVKPIVVILVIASLLIVALVGCQSQPSKEIKVKVIVTQDFGNKIMLDKSVRLASGSNAMLALGKVATVEKKYGGGFIQSINGVKSQYPEINKGWFFYVNGMSANIGALDYKLCPGDVEHWDFHDWSFHAFIPAIIGDFPQPFLGGYQGKILPAIIVYDEGFQNAARGLMSRLEELGVKNIRAQAATELSSQDKKHSNLILLGTRDLDLISELNGNSKLGFYAYFEDSKVVIFDSQGNETQHMSSCGLIQATQNPWNPKGIGACENVVWMISGTDKAAVKDAANTLLIGYEELRYAYAAVIIDGEIIKVP